MGESVTFPSNGSTAHGYLALPESGSGPGLIVIQEWWGLVDHIIDLTNRFAAAGFVALAPDLYGGKTTHDAETAGKYLMELPVDGAARDLSGAVDYLLARDDVTSATVGAVGFCMGGGFVLLLAKVRGAEGLRGRVGLSRQCGHAGRPVRASPPRCRCTPPGTTPSSPIRNVEALAETLRESGSRRCAARLPRSGPRLPQ